MPSLVTVDEVRSLTQSDRASEAIQLLIDDAESEMIRRFGAHLTATAEFIRRDFSLPSSMVYFLERPAASVTSIHEIDDAAVPPTDLTLASNDYRILYGGYSIERLNTGTNPQIAWANHVTVAYVPVSDVPQRRRVLVDLVKLALRYDAVKAQVAGDTSETSVDYTSEREAIFGYLTGFGFS